MLTYCTNIHPGESWTEVQRQVWPQVLKVKALVAPDAPFPVGLRLSARAAAEISPSESRAFLDRCRQENCFIPSINGFPFGNFNQGRIRESVYKPDWRSHERVEYTLNLIHLLERWLPDNLTGSISTVPIGWKGGFDQSDLSRCQRNLLKVLTRLEQSAELGKQIVLALEPEPGCIIETVAELIVLFDRLKLPRELRPFLGVCLDAAHAAVAFEEPVQAMAQLREHQIPLVKLHVSAAARLTANHRAVAWLFREPRYLHQTSIKTGEEVLRFDDLPDALLSGGKSGEWRIHFHLPVYDCGNHLYGTTHDITRQAVRAAPPATLLEIETYTYDVLPRPVEKLPLVQSIAREFDWVRSCL